MSRSYRGIVLACVGIASIAAGVGFGLTEQARYADSANQQAANYAKNSANQITKACLRLARVEQAKCFHEGAEKHRLDTSDKQREYDDLVAQRKSALWSMIMGIAALLGMVLSIVGVVLVWTTFRETQKATIAARDAADSAAKTLQAERAWMTALHVECTTVMDEGIEKIQCLLKWQNSGRSPAINAVCAGNIAVTERDGVPIQMIPPSDENAPRMVIGAGNAIFGPAIRTGPQISPKVLAQEVDLHVYSRIAYHDIFDPAAQRVSEAYFRVYLHRTPDGGVMTQCQPIGPQNYVT